MRMMRFAVVSAVGCIAFCNPARAGECPIEIDLNGGVNDYVYALAEYNGQLIAGGDFTQAGGLTVNHIALWNGSDWASIGGALNTVREMTVYQDKLIATNGGNVLASWDGATWQSHSPPSFGGIECFAVYNNEFILGGQWFVNNDFINVLRWNFDTGQWQAIGAAGTFGTYKVKTLAVHEGKLIAGGDFFVLNGKPVAALAWWDEATQLWQPFEPGLTSGGQVYALSVYNGDLIVAGGFTHVGGIYSRGIARWNSTTGWHSLAGGVSQYVSSLAIDNGDLIAGGYFTTAGSAPVNNIARWNDSIGDWQSVGDGVTNCCGYGAAVYALGVANGKLYAGGWFGFGQDDGPQHIVEWENCPQPCAGDITGDQNVNVSDLLAVINAWGFCPNCELIVCPPDIAPDGGDCFVNVMDLLKVINSWGVCP